MDYSWENEWESFTPRYEVVTTTKSHMEVFIEYLTLIVTLTGFVGNLLICFVIISKSRMRSPLNLFLLNLAVQNFFDTLTVTTHQTSHMMSDSWIFGKEACFVSMYTWFMDKYFESFIISVMFPVFLFWRQIGYRSSVIIIIASWIAATLAAIPYGYHVVHYEVNSEKFYCMEDSSYREHYNIIIMIITILVPIVVIFVSLIVNKKLKRTTLTGRYRIIPMIGIISISSWIVNAFVDKIIIENMNNMDNFDSIVFLSRIKISIEIISFVYKPILYFCVLDDFNQEFKNLFCCSNTRDEPRDQPFALYNNEVVV